MYWWKMVSRAKAKQRLGVAIIGLCVGQIVAGAAYANPTGATVVHGNVQFSNPNAHTLNITNSPNAIINWQQFGIGQNEITRFIQQNGGSAVLNRVTGGNPSQILGQLLSNGRVFLINPSGMVFGQGAVIDTAGFIGSTLNITDDDFLKGNYSFVGDGGSILNQGIVRAGQGGNVILIAPDIENGGVIEVGEGGNIVLAAGKSLTLTSWENPTVKFELQAPDDEVVNIGKTLVQGGAVRMFAGTIRHSGEAHADSVRVGEDGSIELFASNDVIVTDGSVISASGVTGGSVRIASDQGDTKVAGRVDVSATHGGGGSVHVLGKRVGVFGDASIDASGRDGGGQVLVGGDYQGQGAIQTSELTVFAPDSVVNADAIERGDGGTVIFWSDGHTAAYGSVYARGGSQNGHGGFVEISGKQTLGYAGFVDVTADNGSLGTVLFDPTTLQVTASANTYTNLDNAGNANGELDFGDITVSTTTNVDPASLNAVAGNVILQADEIIFSSSVTLNTVGKSLTAQATNSIEVSNGATVATSGGAISFFANTATDGNPASGAGGIKILGNLETTANGNANGADIVLMINGGTGIIEFGGAGNQGVIDAGNQGDITLNASGKITDSITANNGKLIGDALHVTTQGNVELGAGPHFFNSLTLSKTGTADASVDVKFGRSFTLNNIRNEGIGPSSSINLLGDNGGACSGASTCVATVSGDVKVDDFNRALSIDTGGGGGVLNGGGHLVADYIFLQTQGATGPVGDAGSLVQTSSVNANGTTQLNLGGTGHVTGAFVNHKRSDNGVSNLQLQVPNLATNTSLQLKVANGNLDLTNISTGFDRGTNELMLEALQGGISFAGGASFSATNLSVRSQNTLNLVGTNNFSAGTGTLLLESTNNDVLLGANQTYSGANIFLLAKNNLDLNNPNTNPGSMINAGTGAITLTATNGSIVDHNSVLKGGSLTAMGNTGVNIGSGAHEVGTVSLITQSGNINYNTSQTVTFATVRNSDNAGGGIFIVADPTDCVGTNCDMRISNTIEHTHSSGMISIDTGGPGRIYLTNTNARIRGNDIDLQTGGGSTGTVGIRNLDGSISNLFIESAANGTPISLDIGSSTGAVSGVYLTANAPGASVQLSSLDIASPVLLDITDGNLDLSSLAGINTKTDELTIRVSNGGIVFGTGFTLSGSNISIETENSLNLSNVNVFAHSQANIRVKGSEQELAVGTTHASHICAGYSGSGGSCSVSNSDNEIHLSANRMNIGNQAVIESIGGLVTLGPADEARDIGIVSTISGNNGILELTPAMLKRIGTFDASTTDFAIGAGGGPNHTVPASGQLIISTPLNSGDLSVPMFTISHRDVSINAEIGFNSQVAGKDVMFGAQSQSGGPVQINADIDVGAGTFFAASAAFNTSTALSNHTIDLRGTMNFGDMVVANGTVNIENTVNVQTFTIPGDSAATSQAAGTGSFSMTGGTLTGPGALNIAGSSQWNGGTWSGTGARNISGAMQIGGNVFWTGTSSIAGSGKITVNNSGVFNVAGSGNLSNPIDLFGVMNLLGGSSATVSGAFTGSGSVALNNATLTLAGPTNLQGGTWSGSGTVNVAHFLNVTGKVNLALDGTLNQGAGGVIEVRQGGELVLGGATTIHTETNVDGTVTKTGTGTVTFSHVVDNNGTFDIDSGTVVFQNGFEQQGGTLHLSAGSFLTGDVRLTGGTFSGSGTVNGNVNNQGGTISPGDSPGEIRIGGNLVLGSGSTIDMVVEGLNAGEFDKLVVDGSVTMGGAFKLSALDGVSTSGLQNLEFFQYGGSSGQFSEITQPAGVQLAFDSSGASASSVTNRDFLDPGIINPVNPVVPEPAVGTNPEPNPTPGVDDPIDDVFPVAGPGQEPTDPAPGDPGDPNANDDPQANDPGQREPADDQGQEPGDGGDDQRTGEGEEPRGSEKGDPKQDDADGKETGDGEEPAAGDDQKGDDSEDGKRGGADDKKDADGNKDDAEKRDADGKKDAADKKDDGSEGDAKDDGKVTEEENNDDSGSEADESEEDEEPVLQGGEKKC